MKEDFINKEIPYFIYQYSVPKNFFGQVDANVEWKNPAQSASLFFHTESYSEFKEPECLYLFGRRGTGKTYLIRMLDYEANLGHISTYLCSFIVDEEEAYHDLAIQLRSSPFSDLPASDLVHLLVKKWNWVIITSAMLSVYKYSERQNIEQRDDIQIIHQYLLANGIIGKNLNNSIWKRVSECVNDKLNEIDYTPLKLGQAISQIMKDLFSPNYESAFDALIGFLKSNKGKCLIMIDSIEVYELYDPVSEAVTTALIEAIRQFNAKQELERIVAKAAFPSEMYPRLKALNKEKVEGNNLFILWRYKDLMCLLAKRYYHRFGSKDEKVTLQSLENYRKARSYLYKYLPVTVTTEQGIEFDTLAYIIRHTQKKPRQVIVLFNIMHTLAEQKGINEKKLPADFICRGVHARLDLIVDGSLDIFEQIFQNATAIVKRILHNLPACFDFKTLTKKLPEANTLRAQSNLSREDLIRLLLESGSVGVRAGKERRMPSGVHLIEGFFEYQIKGILQISNASEFIVHPMLYQDVQTEIDLKQFVYPVPLENEEKEIIDSMHLKLR